MSVPTFRRPGAALLIAALLSAGLAAPASASPWSDAWERLVGWFAQTSLGAHWADRAPRQILGNEGVSADPNGRPAQILSDEGISINPDGVPRP
ncbi:MAG TPA: hypothetical protein VGS22_19105 [Thermoanaerobaculia bacterium]|jgi:hypothetical protein|nr:hypothetical protein [Thermoanaerobaculia bacterium]